jgi:hypothetical protein
MNNAAKIGGLLAAMLFLPVAASAAPVSFTSEGATSNHNLGAYTGTIELSDNLLTVQLNNTSPLNNGGFLVAFALNRPNDNFTVQSVSSSLGTFSTLLSGPVFATGQFGDFDFGVAVNSFLGGGPPAGGIPVNGAATFIFTLAGDITGLTTGSFLNAQSTGGEWIAARFRGFEDGGSDVVGATPLFDDPPNEIPEPTTMALLGGSLVGLALLRRRRQQA